MGQADSVWMGALVGLGGGEMEWAVKRFSRFRGLSYVGREGGGQEDWETGG